MENSSHSMPNMRKNVNNVKDADSRKLYSLSLSEIRKHSNYAEYNHKPSPFNLRWINGYNAKVGVINLNVNGSTTAFYAACNCAVLYNWTTNQMRILQGHRHAVAFLASDSKGKWLVTADSGPENIVIIWDSRDYFPQRTLFSPHKETRLAKVALSADAKYLLTLGYKGKAAVYWWIWSEPLEEPHAKLHVDIPRDSVVAMGFNPYDSKQFLLMTKQEIWIGISRKVFVFERGLWKETDEYELKIRCPEKNVGPEVGRMTCYTFVEDTAQVLVATSRGNVIVYGHTIEHRKRVEDTNYENLRYVKVVKVEKEKINVIQNVDGLIVTGNKVGEIHFYDDQLKLLYWIHGFAVDSVRGLSFNIAPRSYQIFDPQCKKMCPCWEKIVTEVDPETKALKQKLLKTKIPSDATTEGKPLVVRDFIVCTHKQGVGFVDYAVEKFHPIIENKPSHALSLSVHPEKPFVCIGYANGTVELFNFLQHKVFMRLELRERYKVVVPPRDDSIKGDCEVTTPDLSVTCLQYSPSGLHLACGLNSGELIFLDPTTIAILNETPYRDSSYEIKLIDFSYDSLTMAYSDAGRTVCVYKYECDSLRWQFVGKHRAHYKDITALLFLPQKNPDGEYKLLSLGADRIMVEYDIGRSADDYLEVASLDRVEQTAVPLTAIAWLPPSHSLDPDTHHTNLPTILIANDEHKYKLMNYETTMTVATVLGPRYEYPVCWLKLVRALGEGEGGQYLVFATNNVIGLQKLPLDGNPWKHVGLIGHPLQIIGMSFREDRSTLFTIGAKDSCMCQWAANYRSAEMTTKRGGVDLDPYYCLIENGRPGWLFQEIRDLFYYIQILCQGTFSPAMRRVKDFIPIDSLPDLMRVLGFFPTEYEVENLLTEAKYKVYQKQPSSEVDFEEFVKLYLNHRPAFGDSYARIRSAFHHFALERENHVMTRDEFIDVLSNYGECFSQSLSWYLLSILSGHSFEDRASMTEGDFSFLPEDITLSDFTTTIIGIQDLDNLSEQYSIKDSYGSQQTGSSMESDDK
ncbi:hypothetical protein evm_000325 [Chilo suppressalis]|nr:hypothetical protein evm_000325 [Chilo suppressalis]